MFIKLLQKKSILITNQSKSVQQLEASKDQAVKTDTNMPNNQILNSKDQSINTGFRVTKEDLKDLPAITKGGFMVAMPFMYYYPKHGQYQHTGYHVIFTDGLINVTRNITKHIPILKDHPNIIATGDMLGYYLIQKVLWEHQLGLKALCYGDLPGLLINIDYIDLGSKIIKLNKKKKELKKIY